MKKILSLVLTLALLATMCVFTGVSAAAAEQWNGEAATSFSGGDGTSGNPYKIASAAQLKLFANIVNGKDGQTSNPDICGILTADIVLNTGTFTVDDDGNPLYNDEVVDASVNEWFPIGYRSDEGHGEAVVDISYTGTFDGAGHTVSGLYFNKNQNCVGLFGRTASGAEISNLGVVNSYINTIDSGNSGSVCGANKGTIIGCYNTGSVNGWLSVGGVCGTNKGTITGCYNIGTIITTNIGIYDGYGGVCGQNQGTITDCYNAGTVNANQYVGGVSGTNVGTITGCYNTGAVYGYTYVGGVCGSVGMATASIKGCFNTGTVTIIKLAPSPTAGGVAAYNIGSVIGCYYLDTCAVEGTTFTNTDGEEKNADEMKSLDFVKLLNANGGNFAYRKDTLPLLSWQPERNIYGTNITYSVDSIYYVDIPGEVTLGSELSVSASGVILEEGKQLNVALTGTSESDDTFKVTNGGTGVLEYTVTNGNEPVAINSTVLTVNPKDGSTGETTLTFKAPTDTPKYSGSYTGTVTFTVSVTDQPTEFFLATDYSKNDTIALYCAPGTTWEEWIESADNIYGMQKDEGHIAIYGSSGVVDEDTFILCSASTWDVDGGKWERSRPIEFVEVIKEITYVLVPASELMG